MCSLMMRFRMPRRNYTVSRFSLVLRLTLRHVRNRGALGVGQRGVLRLRGRLCRGVAAAALVRSSVVRGLVGDWSDRRLVFGPPAADLRSPRLGSAGCRSFD